MRSDVAIGPLGTPVRLAFGAVWNARSSDEPLLRRFGETLAQVVTTMEPVSAAIADRCWTGPAAAQ